MKFVVINTNCDVTMWNVGGRC